MGTSPAAKNRDRRGRGKDESGKVDVEDKLPMYLADYEKTWNANLIRSKRKQPLLPYIVNRKPSMIESVDELMMMVSGETHWMVHDMIGMDIIRFLKVVKSVRKKIQAKNESQNGGKENGDRRKGRK